jgi:hypothetical protein
LKSELKTTPLLIMDAEKKNSSESEPTIEPASEEVETTSQVVETASQTVETASQTVETASQTIESDSQTVESAVIPKKRKRAHETAENYYKKQHAHETAENYYKKQRIGENALTSLSDESKRRHERGYNSAHLIGRVGVEPHLRGSMTNPCVYFSLATNHKWKPAGAPDQDYKVEVGFSHLLI